VSREKTLPASPSWVRAPLADLCFSSRNRVNPQAMPSLPYIGMDNVEPQTMRLLGTVPAGEMRSAAIHFQKEDVLYGRLRPYLNKVITAAFEGLSSAEFIPLTPRLGVLPRYLQYRLNAPDFVSFASHLNEGDRPRVDWGQIAAFPIEVPPSAEQRRIVDAIDSYLSRLGEAEAALERVQRNLKRYRAAVLQAAVEGRLVPTEAELARAEGRTYEPASELLKRILAERRRRWEDAELARLRAAGKAAKDDETKEACDEPPRADADAFPTLPEGWRWASIDQLGEVSGGLTKNARRHALGHHLPYLRVANVYADELRLEDVQTIGVADSEIPRTLLYRGDLLVVEGNGSLDQIGRVAVWDGSVHPCAHQNHIIKVRFSPPTMSAWALTWLLSSRGRAEIQRVASSTSGLHTLSLSKVGNLPVPVPPLAEQIRIQAEVDRCFSVVRALGRAAATAERRLQRLRQAILKWAFEGKLVDQDPNDEPASVLLERIRSERAARA